jgi:chlorobactene glucosyltransferase
MAARAGLTTAVIVVAEGICGWVASRHYHALPLLADQSGPVEGAVSIVIPARDEADRVPTLLESLAVLEYPAYEVVVVDDGSSDRTGEIAMEMGARVIRIAHLPAGWTGKAYACQTGADATQGRWLLFTDADTIHAPQSLRFAVSAAIETDSALVSLLARQSCRSFWEQLLLPYAYALYFVGARHVNTPGGPAVANGQYMLFRRDDYNRAGGHSAIRGSIIEDIDMARLLASRGHRVTLFRGEKYVSVRMYPRLAALWEGFAKNAFRFAQVSPMTGVPTAVGGLIFLAGASQLVRRHRWSSRLALLLAPAAALRPWYARFGVPPIMACLTPLAAITFQLIALDSVRRALLPSGATWKGRRY